MDLLVTTKSGKQTKLSEFGLQTISFEDEPASISRVSESFAGRNGMLDYGGQHVTKKIKITAVYCATSISSDETVQESVNGLLSQVEPYYITAIYNNDDVYDFERPGQTTGVVNWVKGTESHKRFLVYRSSTDAPEFQGKVGNQLISTWSFEFETAELPYGESKPRDVTVNGTIQYAGTVACSQLEQAFYIVLTAKAASDSGLQLTIGDSKLDITRPVVAGDVYTLSGMNNLCGSQNINNKTNYVYFTLLTGDNKVTCSIGADIQVKNLKDLYL